MRSQSIIAVLTLLAGIASAIPSAFDDTAADVDLVRRNKVPPTECKDCPPDPYFNCTSGCLSIVCQDCDGKEDCCKCIGLDKDRHVLHFSIKLICSFSITPIPWSAQKTSKSTRLSMPEVTLSTGALLTITFTRMIKEL
jgi:hypothetical protein